MKAFFITGTDTGVGKTFVTQALLQQFNHMGLKANGFKPIASGCELDEGSLYNDDAKQLQEASYDRLPYEAVNPIAFFEPIAPHIAAKRSNNPMSHSMLHDLLLSHLQSTKNHLLIEGAGGWSLPLNERELFSSVITELRIPVILVVGMKLGCLNHAIQTIQSIEASNGILAGWVANCFTPDMPELNENLVFLKSWISAPCISVVPYQGKANFALNELL